VHSIPDNVHPKQERTKGGHSLNGMDIYQTRKGQRVALPLSNVVLGRKVRPIVVSYFELLLYMEGTRIALPL
jgi:hypothetical protein